MAAATLAGSAIRLLDSGPGTVAAPGQWLRVQVRHPVVGYADHRLVARDGGHDLREGVEVVLVGVDRQFYVQSPGLQFQADEAPEG